MKLFSPSKTLIKNSNLFKYENFIFKLYKKKFKNYLSLWKWTIKFPEKFWLSIIYFFKI